MQTFIKTSFLAQSWLVFSLPGRWNRANDATTNSRISCPTTTISDSYLPLIFFTTLRLTLLANSLRTRDFHTSLICKKKWKKQSLHTYVSLAERKIRRGRHLRRPMHLLQHGPAQVLHHDPRQVDPGQELAGPESDGDRTHARRGQGQLIYHSAKNSFSVSLQVFSLHLSWTVIIGTTSITRLMN